jgi:hypothetical protein
MLVIAQVALVVVLLTGAGLFLHSYINVLSVETGFSPSTRAVDVVVSPSHNILQRREAFYTALLERISTQHGIGAAGLINFSPLTDSESLGTLWVDGYPNQKSQLVEERAPSHPATFSPCRLRYFVAVTSQQMKTFPASTPSSSSTRPLSTSSSRVETRLAVIFAQARSPMVDCYRRRTEHS